MIEFDPTEQGNVQNENWNRAEQSLQGNFILYFFFSSIRISFFLAIDQSIWQQPSGDLIKIFFNWLTLAFELHKLSSS